MVAQLGMTETLGPVNYGDSDQQPFLGYSLAQPRQYSEETAALIDRETKRLIEEAHDRARRLLIEHRAQLDRLANELLTKESIEQAQVLAILEATAEPQVA
jgi:cell division protease FtsH